MRCDEQIDSLSIVQAANGVAKSKTATGVFCHRGGQSTFGGRSPPDGDFLVNFLCKENWNNRCGERLQSARDPYRCTLRADMESAHTESVRFRPLTEIT